ncbi:MAG: MmcQ/YjbR family DNA-binding protein [Actinomycetota bacterium]
MTEVEFRQLALALPEAVEASHMGRADFRVRNKVFATLGAPREGWGTLKLTPEQQKQWMEMLPEAFTPAAGAWGRRGWTHLELAALAIDDVQDPMTEAWRNVASRILTTTFDSAS